MIGPILVMVFMVFMALVAYWGFSTQKVSLDNIFNERFDGYKKSSKRLVYYSSDVLLCMQTF